ncbi:hypothetical protein R3P38DRAFT_3530384 [Favolaschia claudopus]|uniref:DUF6593 domain-containing protein n=1 Tax=Favolaschia claudopus TaxID=2862362 RepID=A0AAW0BKL3_9AGAR
MHLTITPQNPLNATYLEASSGRALYRVHTEMKVHDTVTTVTRRLADDVPHRGVSPPSQSSSGQNLKDLERDADSASPQARFGFLAQILWKVVGPTTIRIGDAEFSSEERFRSVGFGLFGLELGYTSSTGHEFRCRYKPFGTTMELQNEPSTVVANFHAKSLGVVGEAKDASLELSEEFGDALVDELFVAFLYVQKRRKL